MEPYSEPYSEQYSETITTIFAAADEEPRRPSRRRRNPSRVGELVEAAFLYKAAGLDFGVAKPWNSERYDFIIDSGARLWRVQLKCTEVLRARGYDVQPRARASASTPATPASARASNASAKPGTSSAHDARTSFSPSWGQPGGPTLARIPALEGAPFKLRLGGDFLPRVDAPSA